MGSSHRIESISILTAQGSHNKQNCKTMPESQIQSCCRAIIGRRIRRPIIARRQDWICDSDITLQFTNRLWKRQLIACRHSTGVELNVDGMPIHRTGKSRKLPFLSKNWHSKKYLCTRMALKFASSSEWLKTNVAIPAHFFGSTGLEEWPYF